MKLKVLVTLNNMNIGGSQAYAFTLINELKAKGHIVFVASDKGEMVRDLEKIGVKHFEVNLSTVTSLFNALRYGSMEMVRDLEKKGVEHYGGGERRLQHVLLCARRFLYFFVSSIVRIRNIVRKEGIHLVHAMQPGPILTSSIVSRLTGIPLVATVHAPGRHEFPIHGFKLPGIADRIKKIIAVSQETRQYLISNCGVNEKKIVVIPNGVDLEVFRPSVHKKDLKRNEILYVSGIYHFSSVISLISATPQIAQRVSNIKVIIVGRGHKLDEVTKLAKKINDQLGNETIVVAGTQSKDVMPRIMSSADVVIALGRAALEAMACGKPVIIAGRTGFGGIVTRNNINQLKTYNFSGRNSSERTTSTRMAESVLKLLTSKKHRESLGFFGREMVEREFDIRKIAGQIENVYLSAVRT